MNLLKQSTAFTWKAGPFLDDTDGKTAETGLSIDQADIRLSKAGGDFAKSNNSAGATHDENGYYDVPLDTTDTGTVGVLKVAISKSGALAVWETFFVVPANVYDSMVAGSDKLEVDVAQWKGSTAPAMTGDAFARLGAPAGASIAADIAAAQAILAHASYGNAALKNLIDTIDGIIDNIFTAFELDVTVYRLTENAMEQAPAGEGGGEINSEVLDHLATMMEIGISPNYCWTVDSLTNAQVGTGGFTAADRAKLYSLVTQIEENRAASSFSYSDESTDPIHKLRRMIGDTDSSDILLTDGELALLWADNQKFPTEKENLNLCAAEACEEIASAFARDAVKAVGDIQQNLAQKSDNYRKQARVFRQRDDAEEDTTGSAGPGFCSSVTTNAPRFGRRSRRCP